MPAPYSSSHEMTRGVRDSDARARDNVSPSGLSALAQDGTRVDHSEMRRGA
ncbi:hypothetical protein ABZV31_16755 [Streptomyces sp. NPDC005202]|uniref:hypothetical protein n=1 Tax=Streptomyces sp. NPDC005202 TaxID=3157021 RepID=UPI0033B75B3F